MILRENWDIMIHRYKANGEGVLHPVILEGWKKRVTFFLWSLRLLIQIWQNKQKSEKSKLRHKSSRESGEEDSCSGSIVLKECMPMISKSKLKGAQWTLVNGDANCNSANIYIYGYLIYMLVFPPHYTWPFAFFQQTHATYTYLSFLTRFSWPLAKPQWYYRTSYSVSLLCSLVSSLIYPHLLIQMAYFAKCFSFFAIFKWIHIFTV